jgi:hypothetical protein
MYIVLCRKDRDAILVVGGSGGGRKDASSVAMLMLHHLDFSIVVWCLLCLCVYVCVCVCWLWVSSVLGCLEESGMETGRQAQGGNGQR